MRGWIRFRFRQQDPMDGAYCRLPPQAQADRQAARELMEFMMIHRFGGGGAHHQWRCIGGQKGENLEEQPAAAAGAPTSGGPQCWQGRASSFFPPRSTTLGSSSSGRHCSSVTYGLARHQKAASSAHPLLHQGILRRGDRTTVARSRCL